MERKQWTIDKKFIFFLTERVYELKSNIGFVFVGKLQGNSQCPFNLLIDRANINDNLTCPRRISDSRA
jgi:hypothetical protein